VPPSGGVLELRVPPSGGVLDAAWADRTTIDVPIVVGRCALGRADVARLSARSLVTIEPVAGVRVPRVGKPVIAAAELEILGGTVGIRPKAGPAGAGDVVAEVVTGYVPRPMSLPDDAHVELTVGLGTTRMSLRQIFELAVGQVVTLGRPLAGPFELRAAGKLVGKGELVDVDGELAVRIVSLGDQE
jgi:type III secretion protein Q